jgi:hypothetical protein
VKDFVAFVFGVYVNILTSKDEVARHLYSTASVFDITPHSFLPLPIGHAMLRDISIHIGGIPKPGSSSVGAE